MPGVETMANEIGRYGACGVARSAHALSRIRATGARTKWSESLALATVPLERRWQATLRVVNSGEEALKSSRSDEGNIAPLTTNVNVDSYSFERVAPFRCNQEPAIT